MQVIREIDLSDLIGEHAEPVTIGNHGTVWYSVLHAGWADGGHEQLVLRVRYLDGGLGPDRVVPDQRVQVFEEVPR